MGLLVAVPDRQCVGCQQRNEGLKEEDVCSTQLRIANQVSYANQRFRVGIVGAPDNGVFHINLLDKESNLPPLRLSLMNLTGGFEFSHNGFLNQMVPRVSLGILKTHQRSLR